MFIKLGALTRIFLRHVAYIYSSFVSLKSTDHIKYTYAVLLRIYLIQYTSIVETNRLVWLKMNTFVGVLIIYIRKCVVL